MERWPTSGFKPHKFKRGSHECSRTWRARRAHQLLSGPAEQVVQPGVEGDALILAQGGVVILERFQEHEHESIAEATCRKRRHEVLAAEVARLTSAFCLEIASLQKRLQPVVAALSRLLVASFPLLGGVTSFSAAPPSKL